MNILSEHDLRGYDFEDSALFENIAHLFFILISSFFFSITIISTLYPKYLFLANSFFIISLFIFLTFFFKDNFSYIFYKKKKRFYAKKEFNTWIKNKKICYSLEGNSLIFYTISNHDFLLVEENFKKNPPTNTIVFGAALNLKNKKI